MKENHQEIYLALRNAVIAGGKAIMDVHDRDDFRIFTKQGVEVQDQTARKEISTNYTTEADLASHRAIAQIVGEECHKGIPLIFEETYNGQATRCTYISFDEMDGTEKFIKREPGFMVLSQYIENGIPVVSVNYDPINDKLFYAIKGEGSFINDSKIKLSLTASIRNARVIVSARDKEKPENADYWKFMQSNFGERLFSGLATGSRMAAVLSGDYDCFVNNTSESLHVWDIGMTLNISEAGGLVSRKDGSPIEFQKPGFIDGLVCSANVALHEEMIQLLMQHK
ncbi:MAG: inositol monophosphatase family protein [Nanoarchaeota archaeon]|nr:inositol monophosphatase family protein [Nanoarchaeota archaeon]